MALFLKTTDFSVSKEIFELHYDPDWDMLVTQPQPRELAPYYESEHYLSHTDAQTSFTDKLYQVAKRFALRQKMATLQKLGYKKGRLLDIGAGTGDFLVAAQTHGFAITGVEPNAKARARAEKKGIALHREISEVSHTDFDVITLWHVLEHLPHLQEQLKQMTTLLNDKGILIVAVPNYKSYDARHYGAYWAGYDVPRHLWHFSKTAIAKLFGQYHMEVVATRPMLLDAFYVSLLSEKYKGSSAAMLRAFYVGLCSNIRGCFTQEYSSLLYALKKA